MSKYDKTNTFVLFPVDDRKTDKHPNLSGTLNIDGVEYFIDGWTNTSQAGKKYISGKAKRKEKQSAPAEARASRRPDTQQNFEPLADEDIPF
jgi:uncharacterized protein (DUF736 family)